MGSNPKEFISAIDELDAFEDFVKELAASDDVKDGLRELWKHVEPKDEVQAFFDLGEAVYGREKWGEMHSDVYVGGIDVLYTANNDGDVRCIGCGKLLATFDDTSDEILERLDDHLRRLCKTFPLSKRSLREARRALKVTA